MPLILILYTNINLFDKDIFRNSSAFTITIILDSLLKCLLLINFSYLESYFEDLSVINFSILDKLYHITGIFSI